MCEREPKKRRYSKEERGLGDTRRVEEEIKERRAG